MNSSPNWIDPAVNFWHGPLQVSANRHFLQHRDGAPFFWLADTAWELFQHLMREEIEMYLKKQRAQGFTVIQIVALAEFGSLTEPNANGHMPLINLDPLQPNEDYFAHVDWVMHKAAEKGLFVGLLPTWGDQVQRWGRSANYDLVAKDYGLTPTKPVIDGEPRYDDHAVNWRFANGFFDAFDVRQAAYWAVFSGACGHTYGHHSIWQMWQPGREPIAFARQSWRDSLDAEGAQAMIHLRRLIEPHDYFSRILDQSLILSKNTNDGFHVQACRGNGYALIYIPCDIPVTIDLSKMGASAHTYWFNPHTSEYSFMGQFSQQPQHTFMPNGRPLRHADWVIEIKEVQ